MPPHHSPSSDSAEMPCVSGWSDDELGRLVRAGDLQRLRRGAYVNGVLPDDVAGVHRLLVRATLGGLRRPAVVSHQSAAVLHGLPLWDVALDRVHVTRRPPAWNIAGSVLFCHVARLRDDEIVEIDGVLVTSAVRTALDLARSLPHEAAVVALDAALHGRLLDARHSARSSVRHRGNTGQPERHAGGRVRRQPQRERR